MKFKKNMKRFMTLDRHHAEGFTLVELIVVIAILAILGGVAVPAYGGYVKKANMTADQTLVSEVANALELYYYSHANEVTDGFVVLAPEGQNGTKGDTNGTAAMNAVFGNGWESSVSLKYDGWVSSAVNASNNFRKSSYNDRMDVLLEDIQDLTGALETFVKTSGTQFIGTDYTAFAGKYGIDINDPTQVANAAAIYVAESTRELDETALVDAWTKGAQNGLSANNFSSLEIGTMGNLAAHYARAESLAAYVDAQNNGNTAVVAPDGTTYPSMQAWFSAQQVSGEDPTAVMNSMNTLTQNFATILGDDLETTIAGYSASEQAKQDAKAYLSMMGAIVDNSDALLEGVNKEGGMYGDGTVEQLLNTYMTAADALADADCPEGSIAVIMTNGKILVVGMGEG